MKQSEVVEKYKLKVKFENVETGESVYMVFPCYDSIRSASEKLEKLVNSGLMQEADYIKFISYAIKRRAMDRVVDKYNKILLLGRQKLEYQNEKFQKIVMYY